MIEPLDPLTLPLRGSRLIEASAGTGKTWTIAALYLRLVLGHGAAGAAPSRPLLPAEILVMTFTKAATRELSDRIRQRLVEAAACFRGDAMPDPGDAFLAQLLGAYPAGPLRAAAAWRLGAAAEAMDDAAVYTIDAWCQRMLREHAFDSGSLFDEELQADLSAMLIEAAHDYWRRNVYPLTGASLETALAQWKDVDALAASVRALLEIALPLHAGQGHADNDTLAACIGDALEARSQALARLKAGWADRAAEMLAWLEGHWSRKDCVFDKRQLGQAHCTRWLKAVIAWADDPSGDVLELGAGRTRLTHAGVRATLRPGLSADPPACFAEFGDLIESLDALPRPDVAMRLHAVAGIAERLRQLKARSGRYGFADLLDRLHLALDEACHGDSARRLRQRILAQYPVALIDEFQDTSPVQLAIFDTLYRIEDDEPARALLLIGDPKQSIYGFRGADIHSYLQARRATVGRHHVLGTNHRSTAALVAAVNHVFMTAEARVGEGAFMFRPGVDVHVGGAVGGDAGLPFNPVDAKGRPEQLVSSSGAWPAMTICLDDELRGQGDSRERFAAVCAARIVGLLNDSSRGFTEASKPFRHLRPADIAVLVRTGVEAAAVRHALRRHGVASVYLSDKDSVFDSDEAKDLLRLLQAMAAPRDMRLARAALATPLLASTLAELVALASDDVLFEARCEALQALHAVWQAQGVLAAVRRALHAFDLPARWLASSAGDGERRLTNVLHLAELLQAASASAEGEAALIRWMAERIQGADQGTGGDEAQVLRLESDADLVKVVTVHKAKGLEYPLVFLPFAAHFRAVERKGTPFVYLPDDAGHRVLSLSPTDEQIAAADKERRREDLRLLYVALTRARHGLWVGVAALKIGNVAACQWHGSAIGYLLSGPGEITAQQVAADVGALAGSGAGIELQRLPPKTDAGWHDAAPARLHQRDTKPPLVIAAPYAGRFDRLWSISSYSALVRDAARPSTSMSIEWPQRLLRDDEPTELNNDVTDDVNGDIERPMRPADAPWHRFPRGAFAGNFLHGSLEWLAGEGFALEDSAATRQALVRRCEREGWGHRAADVLAWLRVVCTTPLSAVGASLAGLSGVMPEMEFWLPSDGLRAAAVDALCRRHLLPGLPRPALPERALHGMLMGFADLVFQHGGRCWVLDYKSNALGGRDADYTQTAMGGAMLTHRYDVQAALYLLALHRLLKLRLGGGYDRHRHLGGAVFLFLRGVRGPAAGGYHVAPPLALIDGLDAMLIPLSGVATGASA